MSGDAPDQGHNPPEAGLGPGPPSPLTGQGLGPPVEFKFFGELRRRNVVRVAVLYLIACWLILEPTHVVLHMLDVPAWANRLVLILMAIGFPAIVLFAWVYEITPEGLAPTVEVDPHRSIRAQTGQRLNRAILILMALAITYLLIDKFWLSKRSAEVMPVAAVAPAATTNASSTPAILERSIAVLPFTDMSEKKDQEYFADGMAEEIIDLLAKVPDLRVPARTSSFYFKGKPTKVPDIARELGVAHVLEGSVRKSGNQLRVTAQLVRADNGYHLWSQTYDRDLRDVFKVQDDIANAVVQALQITLMGGPLTHQRGGTQNLEAYQLYLRAMSSVYSNSKSSIDAALESLDQAVTLDPNFGLAWALMATEVAVLTDGGNLPPREGFERARQLAQRALQISPELTEAHVALQGVHQSYDWDWAAAEEEQRHALAIDPTNSWALVLAGKLSTTLGRWEDAERQLRSAVARDPFNTYAYFNLGLAMYGAGRFADSEASYRKLLKIAPTFAWVKPYLARTLVAEGRGGEALELLRDEQDLQALPIALQAAGRRAEADEVLKRMMAGAIRAPYLTAVIYAYRGDADLAFEWLDRAYEERDAGLPEIMAEQSFKKIAKDPRFKAFLRKMKLPA